MCTPFTIMQWRKLEKHFKRLYRARLNHIAPNRATVVLSYIILFSFHSAVLPFRKMSPSKALCLNNARGALRFAKTLKKTCPTLRAKVSQREDYKIPTKVRNSRSLVGEQCGIVSCRRKQSVQPANLGGCRCQRKVDA